MFKRALLFVINKNFFIISFFSLSLVRCDTIYNISLKRLTKNAIIFAEKLASILLHSIIFYYKLRKEARICGF